MRQALAVGDQARAERDGAASQAIPVEPRWRMLDPYASPSASGSRSASDS